MCSRSGLIPSLTISMLLLAVLPALAESVDTAWVRRYNGSGNGDDMALAVGIDGSGNICVTGYSYGSGTGYDYVTVKYYPAGDTAWVRRYDGPGNSGDYAYDVTLDAAGNAYVTGRSMGAVTNSDCATIKYYPNGDTAWVRRYNGPGNNWDGAYAIAVDGLGNVYVSGSSKGVGTYQDYVTIKYYPNGDTAWVRRYNGPGNGQDEARAITLDSSNNAYVTGYSCGGGGYQYVTIRYDPDGTEMWVQRYNLHGIYCSDEARAIITDGSGSVYVTGQTDCHGSLGDYATVKYDTSGNEVWAARYDGPWYDSYDEAEDIGVDDFGNVYVTGKSGQDIIYPETYDYATVKYDSAGNELWAQRYNGPGDDADEACAMVLDAPGNVYVTGRSRGSETAGDFATIKYHPDGDTVWLRRYNGPGNGGDGASAIAVDNSGNVYVTGYSYGSGTGFDYATIRYVQTGTDVQDETGDREEPSEFILLQNCPNPFNQTTKIEFTLAKSGFVSLDIYDILGRKVRSLISEKVSSGYKSVLWDGKNDSGKDAASGIYFYHLKVESPASSDVGGFTETKKLVLLK